eukprot:COSAG02_NODE_4648_length_5134_cov_35.775372_2_plen_717_part_00
MVLSLVVQQQIYVFSSPPTQSKAFLHSAVPYGDLTQPLGTICLLHRHAHYEYFEFSTTSLDQVIRVASAEFARDQQIQQQQFVDCAAGESAPRQASEDAAGEEATADPNAGSTDHRSPGRVVDKDGARAAPALDGTPERTQGDVVRQRLDLPGPPALAPAPAPAPAVSKVLLADFFRPPSESIDKRLSLAVSPPSLAPAPDPDPDPAPAPAVSQVPSEDAAGEEATADPNAGSTDHRSPGRVVDKDRARAAPALDGTPERTQGDVVRQRLDLPGPPALAPAPAPAPAVSKVLLADFFRPPAESIGKRLSLAVSPPSLAPAPDSDPDPAPAPADSTLVSVAVQEGWRRLVRDSAARAGRSMANVRSCYLTPSAMTVQVQLLGLHLMHRAVDLASAGFVNVAAATQVHVELCQAVSRCPGSANSGARAAMSAVLHRFAAALPSASSSDSALALISASASATSARGDRDWRAERRVSLGSELDSAQITTGPGPGHTTATINTSAALRGQLDNSDVCMPCADGRQDGGQRDAGTQHGLKPGVRVLVQRGHSRHAAVCVRGGSSVLLWYVQTDALEEVAVQSFHVVVARGLCDSIRLWHQGDPALRPATGSMELYYQGVTRSSDTLSSQPDAQLWWRYAAWCFGLPVPLCSCHGVAGRDIYKEVKRCWLFLSQHHPDLLDRLLCVPVFGVLLPPDAGSHFGGDLDLGFRCVQLLCGGWRFG